MSEPRPNKAWLQWDDAWEPGMTDSERLEALKKCVVPSFIYTNPNTMISGNVEKLAEYITPALEAAGGNIRVKRLRWYENNSRSALQWHMMDIKTDTPVFSGWSYAQYDEEGKLLCVADFW